MRYFGQSGIPVRECERANILAENIWRARNHFEEMRLSRTNFTLEPFQMPPYFRIALRDGIEKGATYES